MQSFFLRHSILCKEYFFMSITIDTRNNDTGEASQCSENNFKREKLYAKLWKTLNFSLKSVTTNGIFSSNVKTLLIIMQHTLKQ